MVFVFLFTDGAWSGFLFCRDPEFLEPSSVPIFCFHSHFGGVIVHFPLLYVVPDVVKALPASSCSSDAPPSGASPQGIPLFSPPAEFSVLWPPFSHARISAQGGCSEVVWTGSMPDVSVMPRQRQPPVFLATPGTSPLVSSGCSRSWLMSCLDATCPNASPTVWTPAAPLQTCH